jgi:hypothetical protein
VNCQQNNLELRITVLTVLFWAGCAAPMPKLAPLCPGAESVTGSIVRLRSGCNNVASFKANGRCLLEYYDDQGKRQRENFSVKLWINPPRQIYMQADVAFDGRAMVLGANEDEFWFSIRPKISSYWWGQWSQLDDGAGLIINPEILLEAFGITELGSEEDWLLTNDGPYDILIKKTAAVTTRNIYISACNYRAGKIEYFDSSGRLATAVELDKYRLIAGRFWIPQQIRISNFTEQAGRPLKIAMKFTSIKPVNFSDEQLEAFFTRPQPKGFKNVYRVK